MKYDFEECMRRVRAELQAVFKENQIKAGILEMFKPTTEKPKLTSEQQKLGKQIFADTIKPTNTKETEPTYQENYLKSGPVGNVSKLQSFTVKEINWTETQVQKWFSEKKIDPTIIRNISPCDGRVLYELFIIKNETPEFFYKSIGFANNSFKNTNLRDIAHFSYELKKIFLG